MIVGEYESGRCFDEGLDENFRYFKLDFLDPAEVNRGDKFESIVDKLQDPETGAIGEAVHEREMVVYRRTEDKADLFEVLAKVPTYTVERVRRKAHSWRVMELASMLSDHGLGQGLFGQVKKFVVVELVKQRDRLRKRPEWRGELQEGGQIVLKEYVIGRIKGVRLGIHHPHSRSLLFCPQCAS